MRQLVDIRSPGSNIVLLSLRYSRYTLLRHVQLWWKSGLFWRKIRISTKLLLLQKTAVIT